MPMFGFRPNSARRRQITIKEKFYPAPATLVMLTQSSSSCLREICIEYMNRRMKRAIYFHQSTVRKRLNHGQHFLQDSLSLESITGDIA